MNTQSSTSINIEFNKATNKQKKKMSFSFDVK